MAPLPRCSMAAKLRAAKRLFVTATPRTYSSSLKRKADEIGVEVVGMDDEAAFGKRLHTLPFGEAIRLGLLSDYRVVIVGVDNETIANWIRDRRVRRHRDRHRDRCAVARC